MKRVKIFDGFKTRDERESCFPAAPIGEGRNVLSSGDRGTDDCGGAR